jgi:sialic acid synthase SpsE
MACKIVAEVGINHEGSLEKAKKLILAAKESGADMVKLQTYVTEKRVKADNQFFGLLKDCETTYNEQREMKRYADEIGIEWFSTPFDKESLQFLVEDLGVKKVKFASFDCSNKDLLREANDLGKKYNGLEVILATGMSSEDEILDAVDTLKDVKLTLLHCVSSYPTPTEHAYLLGIETLKFLTAYEYDVGYSDHNPDVYVPAAAVLFGAVMIEKHFTLDKNDSSIDNAVSADPAMFKKMVELVRTYEAAIGTGELGLKEVETFFTIFKRVS